MYLTERNRYIVVSPTVLNWLESYEQKTAFECPNMAKNARNCWYFTYIWGSEWLSWIAVRDHNFVTTGPLMLALSAFKQASYFIHDSHLVDKKIPRIEIVVIVVYYTSFRSFALG